MAVYEITPVVFDIGTAYTKLGFVAEPYPRAIIPTTLLSGISPTSSKPLFDYKTNIQLYDQVVDFIQTLFFKHLLVNPKERKVVLIESVLCPTEVREIFAKVLFRHFEVSSVLFVPTHLVILSTLAVDTALVVDMGFKESIVLPVYCGVQVLQAWQAQPLAADAIHQEIKTQLIANGVSADLLTPEIIEEIKVRTCFVTTYERAQKYKNNETVTPPPDVKYPLDGKEIIVIPGRLRETAYEVLFPEDNDRLGLPYIILHAVSACSLDMRKPLLENVVVVGGTAMAKGLLSRIKHELLALLRSELYRNQLHADEIKFHQVPARENFASWVGGSIYGGTEILKTKSLTKEMYMKLSRVPDWTHLEDNRPCGN